MPDSDFDKHITLTYVNIRQSVFILLIRIVAIDIVFALILVGLAMLVIAGNSFLLMDLDANSVLMFLFVILGIIKIFITTMTVIQWLYEYYEITPEYLVHKKGFFYRKQEKYKLSNVRAVRAEEGFIGEFFNFGTLTIYDIRMQKYLDMYWVHNPNRYIKILTELKPDIEIKKEKTVLAPEGD